MSSMQSIVLMAIGSACAASFYVPFKKVKNWAWESYWIVQGVVAWLVAPWLLAYLALPEGTLMGILSESPVPAKLWSMFFGMLWGVGGLTFGLSIRFLGVALGQSIALGFCAAFGTLIPAMLEKGNLFSDASGILILVGVSLCIAGIAIIGYAGALKNKSLSDEERKAAIREFALKKGLIISVLAGVMSACFAFGLQAGEPIKEVAASKGTNPLYVTNPILIFILLGGFVTNLVYCVFLNIKNKTAKDYISGGAGVILNNIFFTSLAGFLWFMQFQFFGMGQSKLPAELSVFGWSMLMALNILFSNVWGIILHEWKAVGRKTTTVLVVGLVILILSVFVIKL